MYRLHHALENKARAGPASQLVCRVGPSVETIPRMPVHLVGACPIDANGTVTAVGDYVRQASDAMANLVTALAAAGASLGDVLKTTVYVASSDRRDLYAVWQVVHSAFGAHDAPSTLLGVAVLGYADQLVEIEAVALHT
jgi:enamine deaminase RidA (YjgF/YER057c/UK114 family)